MHDDTPNMFCSIVDDIGQRDGLPSESEGDLDRLLSVIVLFDYPFDFPVLDEALFSLAVQDWDRIEVVLALPDCGFGVHREVEAAILAQSWPPMSSRKIVSVSTLSERTLSANLINAGLSYATGQVHRLSAPSGPYLPACIPLPDRSPRGFGCSGGVRRNPPGPSCPRVSTLAGPDETGHPDRRVASDSPYRRHSGHPLLRGRSTSALGGLPPRP